MYEVINCLNKISDEQVTGDKSSNDSKSRNHSGKFEKRKLDVKNQLFIIQGMPDKCIWKNDFIMHREKIFFYPFTGVEIWFCLDYQFIMFNKYLWN